MTKELRGFINRVRKAQDRIFNNKKDDRLAMSISMSHRGFCDVSAYLHDEVLPDVIDSYHMKIKPWSTAEEIEEDIKKLSQIVGFDI